MPGGPGKTTETQNPARTTPTFRTPTGENLFRSYFVRRNSFPTITPALRRSSRRNSVRYAGKGKDERSNVGAQALPPRKRRCGKTTNPKRKDEHEDENERGENFANDGVAFGVPGLHAQETRKLLNSPTPTYPETARQFRLSGVVKVQVVIAPDGQIKEVKVIGGHPVLVNAVKHTLKLKNWKYAPASSETTAILVFNFRP